MPKFEEYKCPVCSQQFGNNDDIVTCPECGTPHHRHCYELTGHCVNKGLHASGYSYYDDDSNKMTDEPAGDNGNGEYYVPVVKVDPENGKQSGAMPTFVLPMIQQQEAEYADRSQTIFGDSMADYAATIRTNVPYFITHFRRMEQSGKKTGWNWCAFVFGSFYLLFRKMYKQGILFLCISMAILMGGAMMISHMAPNFVKAYAEMVTNAKTTQDIMEMSAAMSRIADIGTAQKISYAMLAAIIVVRIIIALFSNHFYRTTISSIIKRVSDRISDGATFTAAPFAMGKDMELSQKQMRRIYLERQGGVSMFAPLVAYSIIYLLLRIM